jgi:hypothetical protein
MRTSLQPYSIFKTDQKTCLHSLPGASPLKTLEDAVAKGISLVGADLSNMNLSNANLDGADLKGARLTGSNLTGANLSEANLQNMCLKNTTLYNTCLAYSDLTGADFEGASFGGTDITGAVLKDCIFTTTSCFTLDFIFASTLKGCIFKNPNGEIAPMSCTPIIIKGLPQTIIFLDRHIKIGGDLLDHHEWMALITAQTKTKKAL